MTTTNHISPSGGQSERPKDDAISRSKRILELIDIYVERPDRMNRNALRSHLFDEFTEAAGIAQTGEDAANGAIGEREAFGSIHEFLGIASKRLYPTPDKPNSDWAKLRAAVDALALLEARAALTAEKVAAEPTSIPFSAYRLKVAEECCERLMSACTDSGCPDGVNMADWIRQLAAPQQPAQSAEQDERAAFDAWCKSIPANRSMGPWEIWQAARAASTQSTATQPAQTQVALTQEHIRKIAEEHFWGGKCTTADDLEKAIVAALREASLAAQPVSGGKS
jgi:hypothetical protein